MSPKYSIIIGLYNHRKYLDNLIQSLSELTYENFEVFFCDDGSDDGTKKYFNQVLKVKFPYKYFWHENKGMRLGHSLDRGINEANGEFCTIIMGDSFPDKRYLDILSQYVSDKSYAVGSRLQIDPEVMKVVDVDYRLRDSMIPTFPMIFPTKQFINVITGNGVTIPTKALREIGGWPKVVGYGTEDNILALNLYLKGYVMWSVPQAIIYHYYHGEQHPTRKNLIKFKKQLEKHHVIVR